MGREPAKLGGREWATAAFNAVPWPTLDPDGGFRVGAAPSASPLCSLQPRHLAS